MLLIYLSLVISDSDKEFITLLYQKLNRRLLGYAYHLSGNAEWARDATQQVFLAAIDRIQILTQMEDDKVSAYCFTIMKNGFLRYLKQKSRESSTDLHETEIIDTSNDHTEDIILKQVEYDAVKAAVEQLPARLRMIISLRFGLNRTHVETAQEMGISVSYSQNLQAEAIRQLKKRLREE